MTLTRFPIGPGVWKDDTPLKAEGYAVDSNWMRVRRGEWETMGGYERAATPSFTGIVRGAHTWADLASTRVLGFGTAAKLFSFYGGAILDITPLKAKGTLVNAFNTKNTSNRVFVEHAQHGLKTNDIITFALADAVGGLTLNGAYAVEIATIDSYFITAAGNASSTATGGGSVEFSVPLDVGLVDGIGGVGYGTGLYNTGIYGTTTQGDIHPRVWSWDNWGNNGIAVPDNGALYEYQPLGNYSSIVLNGDFAAADGWIPETGWAIGSGVATATAGVASDLEQDLTGAIRGGVTYELAVSVTRTAGSLQFRVESAADPLNPVDIAFGEPIAKSATYTRRFTAPPNPTLVKFSKDSTFAGTLDDVSVKVVSTAYRIHDAPPYSRHMFVDPNRFVVLCGTSEQDGDFNALCVRWCDQENNRTWDAKEDNLAGEAILARGSEIRGGIATRSQNLIWTDEALYTMRFSGSSGDVFRFDLVGTGCGLIAKNAAAEFNGVVFWLGADGNFYLFTGGSPQVLQCTVQTDIKNLAVNQQAKVSCGINSQFGEVWWLYPDVRDGKECSRVIVYNWDANVWYTCILPRSQWVDSGVFPNPIAFGLDGAIYYHDRGKTANGDALSWFLKTARFDLGDGDTHFEAESFWPDFSGQEGAVDFRIGFARSANDNVIWYDHDPLMPTTRKRNFRHSGRQMQLELLGSSSPAAVRFGSFRLDMKPRQARR